MHAVILAGGKGTRLRPYTTVIPKPLVPIGNDLSILDVVLQQLAAQGFRSVTLAIGTHGHLIRSFADDDSRWGLAIDYAEEASPLGTIGPLLPVLQDLPKHFLVMNGDVLTDLDFADVLRQHSASDAPLTVATIHRESQIDFGVLTSANGFITRFQEKPVLNHEVSMGVYGLAKATLEKYDSGHPLGFDELVLDLLQQETRPAIYPWNGYWLDIGRPEDYERAVHEFEQVRDRLLPRQVDPERPDGQLPPGPILVLGGTGFLGRHVTEVCREQLDREVIVVARTILEPHRRSGAVEMDVASADVAEIKALLCKLRPAAIINCAGATSASPSQLFADNVKLVSNLVDAIIRSQLKPRLVHIGSAAEYGEGQVGAAIGEDAPARPASLYGATKLAATAVVTNAIDAGAVEGVVLRVFNPVGPGSPPSSVAGRVVDEIRAAMALGDPVRLGALRGRRDFVDVRDVADAVVKAVMASDVAGVVNIAGGEDVPVRSLVGLLTRTAGYDGPIHLEEFEPATSPGVRWQCADITRAAKTLGWVPKRCLADSLRDLWNGQVRKHDPAHRRIERRAGPYVRHADTRPTEAADSGVSHP